LTSLNGWRFWGSKKEEWVRSWYRHGVALIWNIQSYSTPKPHNWTKHNFFYNIM
jgi:hypothetical protein